MSITTCYCFLIKSESMDFSDFVFDLLANIAKKETILSTIKINIFMRKRTDKYFDLNFSSAQEIYDFMKKFPDINNINFVSFKSFRFSCPISFSFNLLTNKICVSPLKQYRNHKNYHTGFNFNLYIKWMMRYIDQYPVEIERIFLFTT